MEPIELELPAAGVVIPPSSPQMIEVTSAVEYRYVPTP
jgi:hypothetical protein